MKICTVCKVEQPLENFGPSKGKEHARASCHACDRAYTRQWRRRNLEKAREIARESARRAVATPEGRAKVNEARRRLWHEGRYKERAENYLNRLKEQDFFRWKARKSYIVLTAEQLRVLWERQGGRCALTGRLLDNNAEIDHIIPKTRGGDQSMENSRWLCSEANQAKRNLLDEEFLALCREIIAYAQPIPPGWGHG